MNKSLEKGVYGLPLTVFELLSWPSFDLRSLPMQGQSSFLSPLWHEINKNSADFSKTEIKLKGSRINAHWDCPLLSKVMMEAHDGFFL